MTCIHCDKFNKCKDENSLTDYYRKDLISNNVEELCEDFCRIKNPMNEVFENRAKMLEKQIVNSDITLSNKDKSDENKTMTNKSNRISKDQYYLDIALAVSKRSTCLKRHYGCVIVNNDEIIATGYNGAPRGMDNCCDKEFCSRMDKPHNSGDYSDCFSVHAEQNAMLSASRKEMIGATLYLAGEELIDGEYIRINECIPCPICHRMIINSGISRVVGK